MIGLCFIRASGGILPAILAHWGVPSPTSVAGMPGLHMDATRSDTWDGPHKTKNMRTHIGILSLVVVLGATACGNADDKGTSTVSNDSTAMVDEKTVVAMNQEAIARRSVRVDGMVTCILEGNADTWKHLSLTTDQIRWMEDFRARSLARNKKASAAVNKNSGETSTYTFSAAESRKLAQILTDEQLDQWTSICPQNVTVSAK